MFSQDAQAGMDHIKHWKEQTAARKAARDNKEPREDFVSQYMKFEKGEQLVRFVGNFFTSGCHFIGNGGKLSFLRLFDDAAFDSKADKHIGKKIICANWDFEKSEHMWEGDCIVCQLNNIAREIVRSSQFKSQSQDDQKRWTALKSKTGFKVEHSWNMIDRLHPEIKAYLMATLNNDMFQSLMTAVHNKWEPRYFAGVEDGVDVSIAVTEEEGGKWKYTAALALNGLQVAMTPLTDEEKAWSLHNLADKFGPSRVPSQELVRSLLMPQWQALLTGATSTEQKSTKTVSSTSAPAAKTGGKKGGPF